jgi:hypothetical protein
MVLRHPRPPLFGFAGGLRAEEKRPLPAGAGDLAGDHREARVETSLEVVPAVLGDRDAMLDALVLAGEHGTRH